MESGKEMVQLPSDLIVEIFSRLPSKSVARFCTLSKHWASKLRSQDFTELFLARSSTRPRLLFAVEQFRYNRWQFFSTPQNHRYENSSHLEFHSKFKGDISRYICSYASGLFYFPKVQILDEEAPLICNPITGLYVRLPHLERYRKSRGFLGFDPIDKQFKVMSEATECGDWEHHNILTLGTGELIWRSNKTTEEGRSLTEGICINGILYFLARMYSAELTDSESMIVCFDVMAETFNFIKAEWFNDNLYDTWGLRSDPTDLILVNYKGKFGGIEWKRADAGGRLTVELCVWVLEDVEKQEWVNNVYTLPENEVLNSCDFSVAGVTTTGDIVLAMTFTCKPFYVFYFNPERNTLKSVEIQGFGADLETVEERGQVHVFVDHVEDLSVNNAKQLQSNISQIRSICAHCKEKEAQGQLHSHHDES